MSYGTVQAEKMTTESGYSLGAGNASSFKNRIINGGMVIDQRNGGASVTPASGVDSFPVDRFSIYSTQASKTTAQQNQGSVTPPAGYTNYLGVTSSSAYSVLSSDLFGIFQSIEGYNTADLAWGTANAKSVTMSFWVYSSLTGTFGGAVANSAQNRSYPFSYTINSANTWEQKTVTIPGDTTGTWLTTNGRGMTVCWSLGMGSTRSGTANTWAATTYFSVTGAVSVVGTSGATFYITGCQLEVGTVATSFDFRSYGTELALCQRYFLDLRPSTGSGTTQYPATLQSGSAGSGFMAMVTFPVKMRTVPSASFPASMTGLQLNWPFPGSTPITNLSGGSPYIADLGACIQGVQTNSFGSAYGTVGFQIGSSASSIGFTAEL